jgi:hypothetical protein
VWRGYSKNNRQQKMKVYDATRYEKSNRVKGRKLMKKIYWRVLKKLRLKL